MNNHNLFAADKIQKWIISVEHTEKPGPSVGQKILEAENQDLSKKSEKNYEDDLGKHFWFQKFNFNSSFKRRS